MSMPHIVTFETLNTDGTGSGYFPEVGMNTRYVSHKLTKHAIVNEARRSGHARLGRKFRVHTFTGLFIGEFNS